MPISVRSTLAFEGSAKITGLPASTTTGEPVVHEQLQAAVEGLSWKDSARVSTQGNINLSAPGATIDGITMAANDRVLVRSQTTTAENGIYIFNGAATPATRSLDANTYDELESATITVDEGTNAGATFRQTGVNGTIGGTAVVWATFGTSAAAATETTAGIAELATQAETDAGTDDARIVTPLKLAASTHAKRKFSAAIGDGSATSYIVTHNFGTRDCQVAVYENSGSFRDAIVEVQKTTVNSVTLLFAAAPASNAYRVVVLS